MTASTRPLIRQIESYQASLSEAQSNSDRVERSLTERLQQSTVQLASAQERERNAAEQYRQLSSKTASLESKLTSLSRTKNDLEQNLNEVVYNSTTLNFDSLIFMKSFCPRFKFKSNY